MAHNTSSSIRGGFNYQRLCTLRLCGEWLLNPELYNSITVEHKIEDVRDFYFDDIVLLDKEKKYHIYQAKFKTNHTTKWTWNDFVNSEQSNSKSLFAKFATSFQRVETAEIARAIFITNADVADEIRQFIVESKLDITTIKQLDNGLYNKILSIFRQEEIIDKLEFCFEQKTDEDLDKEIRSSFYDKLKATAEGVNNLILKLDEESRKKNTTEITLQNLREWCEFDNPKVLNEEFEIPKDFELFDVDKHKHIISDIEEKDRGIKIVHGKPGVGKSTYLSNLAKELSNMGLFVIKHHYHINPSDNNFYDRLNSERVVEAIKAQFKSREHKYLLGDIANQNSRRIKLQEFISCVTNRIKLIIIVDGLDHVLREKDVRELNNFIKEIFHPQKNLWIIFGTQHQVIEQELIQQKFQKCPAEDRIEIQGLTRQGVKSIILKNMAGLHLPKNEISLHSFISKIYEINEGNCLHLRYILIQLKNNLGNQLIGEYACKFLISYGQGIEQYYSDLWIALEEKTKSFLLTLVSISFQFTKEQFNSCISSFIATPDEISSNFKKIKHLIHDKNKLSIYHASFLDFLKKQSEWTEQKSGILNKVKQWLKESKYEDLKWAELVRLEYQTGNPNLILDIDRNWLIEAISYPRNPSQILSQLELASKVALEVNNFAKALETSLLSVYYQNSQESLSQLNESIWIEAINHNPQFINELNIKELPTNVLIELVYIAEQLGNTEVRSRVINEVLGTQIESQNTLARPNNEEIPQDKAIVIVNVTPYDRTHKLTEIFSFIVHYRKNDNFTVLLFQNYVRRLLVLGQKTKVIKLLELSLTESERESVLHNCIRYDLKHQTSNFKHIIVDKESKSHLEKLYLHLQGIVISELPQLPPYDDFPLTLEDQISKVLIWQEKFYDLFLIGLLYALSGKSIVLKKWIDSAPDRWAATAASALFKAAIKSGNNLSRKRRIIYEDIFLELSVLPDIEWTGDNRGYIYFKDGMIGAVRKIFIEIIYLKHFLNDSHLITKSCYDAITSVPFFPIKEALNVANLINSILFEDEVCTIISEKSNDISKERSCTLRQRSEEYIRLSKLNRIHGNKEKAKDLLSKSINNFLGYGEHKDYYLFYIIWAMTVCCESTSLVKAQEWIKRVIPLIMNVEQYTDGKETYLLPIHLADFLAKHNKELLFKFFFDSANDESSLDLAQKIFQHVIQSLKFTEDTEIALASTALDKDSLNILKKKAKTLKGARIALNQIQQYLGEICYEDKANSLLEKIETDYSTITPEKLEQHLSKVENPWDQYLIGWTQYYLNQADKQRIYKLVKSILLKKDNIEFANGKLLDILYPLAYEFGEDDEAFKFLCLAHQNNYGWSDEPLFPQEEREKRWEFIKNKYPKRYLEFFKLTVKKRFPVAAGASFFVYMNEIKFAEEITEASIRFAENLVAEFNLPSPTWAEENYKTIDALDLLFYRLVWPSPLVQERTATAISYLLIHSSKNYEIYNRLLKWIRSWKIETIIAVGLLPIVRAFQTCTHTSKLRYIKVSNIRNSIIVNSVVIEKLLQEIREYTEEENLPIDRLPEIITPPLSYTIDSWFNENIERILPPIYLSRATQITQGLIPDFVKKWAYNAEIMAKESGIERIVNYNFYGEFRSSEFLRYYSPIIGEVYKSAFLRLVNEFYQDKERNGTHSSYALMTLPVNLSLWCILPNSVPQWWPELLQSQDKSKVSGLVLLKEPIKSIVEFTRGNHITVAAEGAIKPDCNWRKNPEHSFSLIGFGYKMLGPIKPSPESVYKKISYFNTTFPIAIDKSRGLFSNHKLSDLSLQTLMLDDMEIVPLIKRSSMQNIPKWQFFQIPTPLFSVTNELQKDLIINLQNVYSLSYQNQQANNIITYQYWLAGLQERGYTYEMPMPHGHYLSIDKGFINSKLQRDNFRLGYALKITFRIKEHSYSELKKIESYEFINLSGLIY